MANIELAKKSDLDNLSGRVTANESDITTLQGAVDGKADESHTHNYNDLTNKPTIPSRTSELANDSGYITGVDAADVSVSVDGLSGTNVQSVIAELKALIDQLTPESGD